MPWHGPGLAFTELVHGSLNANANMREITPGTTSNGVTPVVLAAAVEGHRTYPVEIYFNNESATDRIIELRSATTVRRRFTVPANRTVVIDNSWGAIYTEKNETLNVVATAAGAGTDIKISGAYIQREGN